MKIALPVTEGVLSAHFGHCDEFIIFEVDEKGRKVLSKTFLPNPGHKPGFLPVLLSKSGADLIIANGIGLKAQELFKKEGISTLMGAPLEVPEKIVQAYLEGSLRQGETECH